MCMTYGRSELGFYDLTMRYPSLFFFKQKTAYEMRISDWSSDVCSSDLIAFEPVIGGDPCAHDTPMRDRVRRIRNGAARDRCVENERLDRRKIGRASCRERVCQYV